MYPSSSQHLLGWGIGLCVLCAVFASKIDPLRPAAYFFGLLAIIGFVSMELGPYIQWFALGIGALGVLFLLAGRMVHVGPRRR